MDEYKGDQVDHFESMYPELYIDPDVRKVYPYMAEMNDELIKSIKDTIEFLDGIMVVKPERRIADASNLLQEKLEELEKE